MTLSTQAATRKDKNSGTNTVLEHRHFSFIAAVIADIPANQRIDIAKRFADACGYSNPRFDRQRFLRACSVICS